jgi:hypothetical protein
MLARLRTVITLCHSFLYFETRQGWRPEPTLLAVWGGGLAQVGPLAVYVMQSCRAGIMCLQ